MNYLITLFWSVNCTYFQIFLFIKKKIKYGITDFLLKLSITFLYNQYWKRQSLLYFKKQSSNPSNYCFLLPPHEWSQTYCRWYQSWQRRENSLCRNLKPQGDLKWNSFSDGSWKFLVMKRCGCLPLYQALTRNYSLIACIVYTILINQLFHWLGKDFISF